MFLIVVSEPLLYYASEFKQYSTEALFSVVYLYLYVAYAKDWEQGRLSWKVIFLSMLGILCSLPTVFVLLGVLTTIFVQLYKKVIFKNFLIENRYKIIIVFLWGVLYYFFYLRGQLQTDFYAQFWEPVYYSWGGFPQNIVPYVNRVLVPLFQYFTQFTTIAWVNCVIFLILFITGMVLLFREKRDIFFIILIVCGAHLFCHLLQIYPLGGHNKIIRIRLMLYAFPVVLLPVAFCTSKLWIKICFQSRLISLSLLFCVIVTALLVNVNKMRAGTAWEPSIKNDILWLLQNASEDDAIAVYADATYAYEYYKHQVGNNHSYFVYGAPAANEPLNVFGWRMDIPKEAEKQISKAQVQQKQKIFFLSERISLDEFLFINYLSIHYDVVCLNEKINLCVIELDSGI